MRERVRLSILNVLGQEVSVLADNTMEPGRHMIVWNAKNEPSGVYFCRIRAGASVSVKAMVLQK